MEATTDIQVEKSVIASSDDNISLGDEAEHIAHGLSATGLTLYYNDLRGKCRVISGVTPFTTVRSLKQIIQDQILVAQDMQVLSVGGKHTPRL